MKLTLRRYYFGETETLGELDVNGAFECYTLEDRVRDLGPKGEGKVPGASAIPCGVYNVVIGTSPKFGRVPFVEDVPGFTHIRIHAGNTHEDTDGCILVGRVAPKGRIGESRLALAKLIAKLTVPCTLTIKEDRLWTT